MKTVAADPGLTRAIALIIKVGWTPELSYGGESP